MARKTTACPICRKTNENIRKPFIRCGHCNFFFQNIISDNESYRFDRGRNYYVYALNVGFMRIENSFPDFTYRLSDSLIFAGNEIDKMMNEIKLALWPLDHNSDLLIAEEENMDIHYTEATEVFDVRLNAVRIKHKEVRFNREMIIILIPLYEDLLIQKIRNREFSWKWVD